MNNYKSYCNQYGKVINKKAENFIISSIPENRMDIIQKTNKNNNSIKPNKTGTNQYINELRNIIIYNEDKIRDNLYENYNELKKNNVNFKKIYKDFEIEKVEVNDKSSGTYLNIYYFATSGSIKEEFCITLTIHKTQQTTHRNSPKPYVTNRIHFNFYDTSFYDSRNNSYKLNYNNKKRLPLIIYDDGRIGVRGTDCQSLDVCLKLNEYVKLFIINNLCTKITELIVRSHQPPQPSPIKSPSPTTTTANNTNKNNNNVSIKSSNTVSTIGSINFDNRGSNNGTNNGNNSNENNNGQPKKKRGRTNSGPNNGINSENSNIEPMNIVTNNNGINSENSNIEPMNIDNNNQGRKRKMNNRNPATKIRKNKNNKPPEKKIKGKAVHFSSNSSQEQNNINDLSAKFKNLSIDSRKRKIGEVGGKKNNVDFKTYTVIELKNMCKYFNIKNYSKLNKSDLIKLLKKNLKTTLK